MYAVIRTGGKQYRVEAGQRLRVEKLPGDAGASIEFPEVLMIGGTDSAVAVGTPRVENARVVGEIVEQGRGRKVTVFKYKNKTRYRRLRGHRQQQTLLAITEIQAPDGTLATYELRRPLAISDDAVADDAVADDAVADDAAVADDTAVADDAGVSEDATTAAETSAASETGAEAGERASESASDDVTEDGDAVAAAAKPTTRARKTASKAAKKTAAKKAAKKTAAKKTAAKKPAAKKTAAKKTGARKTKKPASEKEE